MSDIRTTEFEVEYELIDVDAASDANYTCKNVQTFCTPSILSDSGAFAPYITLEHNYSVMDGTVPEFPSQVNGIGFFSKYKTDSTGVWVQGKEPEIEINFPDDVHSSIALTLGLVADAPMSVYIEWYGYEQLLAAGTYTIDEKGETGEPVENYNQIKIKFLSGIPDRYAKLYCIYYGTFELWDETTIKQGTMVKDVDVVSELLPADTLNFDLVDITFGDLNLGNPSGIHKFFQKNQPVYAYEWLNDQRILCGKFFLKTYKHEANVGSLSCVSYIDRMDEIAFNEGRMYNGVSAEVILAKIFEVAGIKNYVIDYDTANQLLYGTLKPQSCRSALREVLFACQSIIDTSSETTVYVKKVSPMIQGTISRHIKFNTRVEKKEYISGVQVEFFNYKRLEERTPISATEENSLYEKGTYTLVFDGPYDNVQFSSYVGLRDIEISTYYVKFTADKDVYLTITGNGYIETSNKVVTSHEAEAGKFLNIKKFTSTLSNYENAKRLADTLLAYYSLDMTVAVKALAMDVDIEHKYIVENDNSKYDNYVGVYSSRSFDLTGGFVHDSKLVMTFLTDADKSYFIKDTNEEELFAGEDTEII